MTEYRDVNVTRILNPTSIDLGEYVINPYKGCEFSCLYCYVRSNKTAGREKRAWGSYVDARVNAPSSLEKELVLKNPACVLLGSTTECFQPIEAEKCISANILEILNAHKVYYVILTRSPYISRVKSLLEKGFCKKIYFMVNNMPLDLKARLEPNSPNFEARSKVINELLDSGIDVVPYFSPVLPWITDLGDVFSRFPGSKSIEFEGLNFNLSNIKDVIEAVSSACPGLRDSYEQMLTDNKFYDRAWECIRKKIVSEAINSKKSYNVHIHRFGGYFENKYKKAMV